MKLIFEEILFASPDYDECIFLRDKVLRKPLNLEFTEEQIQNEWNQTCLVLREQSSKIIACLLFQKISDTEVKMRQVTVDEHYQNKGIGRELVLKSEAWASVNNFEKISLHARDTAVPFYLKLNYKKQGEEFVEVGIAHWEMYKNI